MATIYRMVLDDVERSCKEYRRRALTLDELKADLWKAASQVVAHDERSLRSFLQWAEGQLDIIQFTTDDAHIYDRTVEIVDQVDEMVRRSRELS